MSADGKRELAFSSALRQAELIRRREVSPSEFVDLYLERIAQIDPKLGSYVAVFPESARSAAVKAEAALLRDEDVPLFHGVPLSLKSLIETEGLFTTLPTFSQWAGYTPVRDAAVSARLKAAGFIIIGKTKVTPADVTHPHYGRTTPCNNPWNPDFSPGGTSGGAGVSVAAGLCAAAVGGDNGGSVRLPAAWCGVVGLKPSRGRISQAPDLWDMHYTPGPMTRTVADAAAMLDAAAGYVTGDPYWAPPPERAFLAEVRREPGRLRIAFTVACGDGVELANANAAAVYDVAYTLEKLGHDVAELGNWPGRGVLVEGDHLSRHLALMELGAFPLNENHEVKTGLEGVESVTPPNTVSVVKGLYNEALLSRQIVALWDRCDLLLTPVQANQPFLADGLDVHGNPPSNRDIQFTQQFNVTGQPAISIPAGFDDQGLPIGVQLVGGPADESTVIRVAAQLEEAMPWIDRRPLVS